MRYKRIMRYESGLKKYIYLLAVVALAFCVGMSDAVVCVAAVPGNQSSIESDFSVADSLAATIEEGRSVAEAYQVYENRFLQIQTIEDISACGYEVIEKHVFDIPLVTQMYDEEGMPVDTEVVRPEKLYEISREDAISNPIVPTVRFYTAIDSETARAAVFLADQDGQIIYKTNQLECNYTVLGCVEQPIVDMVSVAFQDLNHDGLTDMTLIAGCVNDSGYYAGKQYKVGEVLFRSNNQKDEVSFYRDWRINDKINRFDMNRSAKCIRSFVRDGHSTEFLYTATTEEELLANGFEVIEEQSYWRTYEKLGKLKVLPGVYSMADYDIFMIYMINEQGDIVWCFQPMGEYDNLYSLRGISGKDLDGDGMKDLLVVARYSKEGENGEIIIEGQYSIYYQRTGGFDMDMEFAQTNPYQDTDTVEALVNKIRSYWGWETEKPVLTDEVKKDD